MTLKLHACATDAASFPTRVRLKRKGADLSGPLVPTAGWQVLGPVGEAGTAQGRCWGCPSPALCLSPRGSQGKGSLGACADAPSGGTVVAVGGSWPAER